MITTIKDLFQSKKFWITIIGSAITAGLTYAGAPNELVITIASLFGVNVAGQGLADLGKNKK